MTKEKDRKSKKKRKSDHKIKNWGDIYTSFINGNVVPYLEILIALIPLIILGIDIFSNYVDNNYTAIKIIRDGYSIRLSPSNENLIIKSLKVHWLKSDHEIQKQKYPNPIDLNRFQQPLAKQLNTTVNSLTKYNMLNEFVSCPIIMEIEFQNKNKSRVFHHSYLYIVNFIIVSVYQETDIKGANSSNYTTRYNYMIDSFHFIKYLPSLRMEKRVLELQNNKCQKQYLNGASTKEEVDKRLKQGL